MSSSDALSPSGMLTSLRAVGPTVGASLINQAVVALSQLIMIPMLIGAWGIEGYGTWLLLTAIPMYLTISDFGFTSSAKSDMSVRVARGDVAGAQVTASSVGALLIAALALIGAVYFGLVYALDWTALLNLAALPNGAAQTVLALGFVQLASYQAFLLSAAIIRAAGRPATEVLLSAGARVLDTIALVTTALLGADIVTAAMVWTVSRLGSTLTIWVVVIAKQRRLVPLPARVSLDRVRALLRPSVAYLLLPLGNAISIQGTVLVLGAIAGPAAVAAFTAMRVVTRLGVSAGNVLNYAFVPQYSYAIGRQDVDQMRSLTRTHLVFMGMGCAIFALTMVLLGPWFVGVLSRGAVQAYPATIGLLTLAAALEMYWSLDLAVRTASNTVAGMAVAWLLVSASSLLIVALLVAWPQLTGAAIATLVAHGAMVAHSVAAGRARL